MNARFNTVPAALKYEFVFWFVFAYIHTLHSLAYSIEILKFTCLLRKSHEIYFPIYEKCLFLKKVFFNTGFIASTLKTSSVILWCVIPFVLCQWYKAIICIYL
jgi:hypothetical protein